MRPTRLMASAAGGSRRYPRSILTPWTLRSIDWSNKESSSGQQQQVARQCIGEPVMTSDWRLGRVARGQNN
jgi:hypothetical protein